MSNSAFVVHIVDLTGDGMNIQIRREVIEHLDAAIEMRSVYHIVLYMLD